MQRRGHGRGSRHSALAGATFLMQAATVHATAVATVAVAVAVVMGVMVRGRQVEGALHLFAGEAHGASIWLLACAAVRAREEEEPPPAAQQRGVVRRGGGAVDAVQAVEGLRVEDEVELDSHRRRRRRQGQGRR